MDNILCTSRNSTNFIQYKTDEGSLDYSTDWDAFSFEGELNARKSILKEDLKAYNEFFNQPSLNNPDIDEAVTELQSNKGLCNKLLKANDNFFSKYTSLMREHKQTKDDLKKLRERKVFLENSIKTLQEEDSTSRKSYQQLKLALQKASEMYTTYFDVKVSIKTLSDTTYEASVNFKESDVMGPIKFVVDRVNRTVIDFQHKDILLSEEERKSIQKEFGNLDNLPGLFCTLHEISLRNKKVL